MNEAEQPTLTEIQIMQLEHAIVGHFLKRGIWSKSTIADYLFLITKHLDPLPDDQPPTRIIDALEKPL